MPNSLLLTWKCKFERVWKEKWRSKMNIRKELMIPFYCRKQTDQLLHLFIALWANTNAVTWLIVKCKRIWSLRVERNWLWNYDSVAAISRCWGLVCASDLLSPNYSMYGLVDKTAASEWEGTSLLHYVYVGLQRAWGSWHIINQKEELLLFVLFPTFETTLRAILVQVW